MNEGWCDDNYLVLFTEEESGDKTRQYKLAEYLPGFRLIGLKGWDDFIVIDQAGNLFSVPTVPMLHEQLESFNLSLPVSFTTDDRFRGKIKWYTKPIIFGGDPNPGENLTWVDHQQHVQLVNWWNELHRSVSKGSDA